MKISKEQMAEHRESIIDSAARGFREKGFEGISVVDLMKEAGLTHGGFYNHFVSKDELICLAIARSFDQMTARWEGYIKRFKADPISAIIDGYLSERHLQHPETGCVVAALATETAKQAAPVKAAMASGIERLLHLLEQHVSGRTLAQRRARAVSMLSQMTGAMILARSQDNPSLAKEFLQVSSDSLTRKPAKNAHGVANHA